jgi:hypothetical protein
MPAGIRLRQDMKLMQTHGPVVAAEQWGKEVVDVFNPQPNLQRAEMLLQAAPKTDLEQRRLIMKAAGGLITWAQVSDPVNTVPLFLSLQVDEWLAEQTDTTKGMAWVLDETEKTGEKISANIPSSWPMLLQTAEQLHQIGQTVVRHGEPLTQQQEVREKLDRLDRLTSVLAIKALTVDDALRQAGETVQIMSPGQRERAKVLSGNPHHSP